MTHDHTKTEQAIHVVSLALLASLSFAALCVGAAILGEFAGLSRDPAAGGAGMVLGAAGIAYVVGKAKHWI